MKKGVNLFLVILILIVLSVLVSFVSSEIELSTSPASSYQCGYDQVCPLPSPSPSPYPSPLASSSPNTNPFSGSSSNHLSTTCPVCNKCGDSLNSCSPDTSQDSHICDTSSDGNSYCLRGDCLPYCDYILKKAPESLACDSGYYSSDSDVVLSSGQVSSTLTGADITEPYTTPSYSSGDYLIYNVKKGDLVTGSFSITNTFPKDISVGLHAYRDGDFNLDNTLLLYYGSFDKGDTSTVRFQIDTKNAVSSMSGTITASIFNDINTVDNPNMRMFGVKPPVVPITKSKTIKINLLDKDGCIITSKVKYKDQKTVSGYFTLKGLKDPTDVSTSADYDKNFISSVRASEVNFKLNPLESKKITYTIDFGTKTPKFPVNVKLTNNFKDSSGNKLPSSCISVDIYEENKCCKNKDAMKDLLTTSQKNTCSSTYGTDYEVCGLSKSNAGAPCCKNGNCCTLDSPNVQAKLAELKKINPVLNTNDISLSAGPYCCKSSEECNIFIAMYKLSPALGAGLMCSVKETNGCLPEEKVCKGTFNICCSKDSACLTYTKSSPVPVFSFVEDFLIPNCGYNKCPDGTTQYPANSKDNPYKGGILCCDNAYEKGIIAPPKNWLESVPVPICAPIKEKPGFMICKGTGEFFGNTVDGVSPWARRWCHIGIEKCGNEPDGAPICINLAQDVGKVSRTSSFSVYMARDPGLFTLNGIAYVIKPHILLSSQASISFNLSESSLSYYKYSNESGVLDSCNSTLLSKIEKTIGASGGSIVLDNISVDLSPFSLDKDTSLTIEEYELKDCAPVSRKDNFDYTLSSIDAMNFNLAASNIPDSSKVGLSFVMILAGGMIFFIILMAIVFFYLSKNDH